MRWWWLGLSTAFCLGTLTGCADGPIPYMMALNPSVRRQWEADEAYQPTLHRQLAEVEALRAQGPRLSEEQQRHWSGELAFIIESHHNPLLRAACVDTLAVLAVPDANRGLRAATKDADSTVRMAACRAWGSRGGREGVELLAEMLGSDTDMDVQMAAARELKHFSDPIAYQALGLALETDNPALQYRAIESLKTASGRNYGNDIRAWQEFAEGKDPGPEHVPALAERLRQLF